MDIKTENILKTEKQKPDGIKIIVVNDDYEYIDEIDQNDKEIPNRITIDKTNIDSKKDNILKTEKSKTNGVRIVVDEDDNDSINEIDKIDK